MPSPAPVQTNLHVTTSGSSPSMTFTNSVVVGHVIGIGIWITETTTTINSVTDNLGHTYTAAGDNAKGDGQIFNYYGVITTGGSCTITAALSATTGLTYVIAQEISGCATASVLDGHNGNSQTSAPNTADGITSNAATTTVNGDYILGIGLRIGSGTWAAGTSPNAFTADTPDTADAAAFIEHFVQTSSGSIAATATLATGLNDALTVMMAFKPPSLSVAQIIPALTQGSSQPWYSTYV